MLYSCFPTQTRYPNSSRETDSEILPQRCMDDLARISFSLNFLTTRSRTYIMLPTTYGDGNPLRITKEQSGVKWLEPGTDPACDFLGFYLLVYHRVANIQRDRSRGVKLVASIWTQLKTMWEVKWTAGHHPRSPGTTSAPIRTWDYRPPFLPFLVLYPHGLK